MEMGTLRDEVFEVCPVIYRIDLAHYGRAFSYWQNFLIAPAQREYIDVQFVRTYCFVVQT